MPQARPVQTVFQTNRRQALGWTAASAWAGLGLAPGLVAAAADAPEAGTAPPAELLTELPGARAMGAGTLRFLGLEIYAARLWVQAGFSAGAYAQSPFALELTYHRSLSGRLIAERSLKEMQRQGPWSAAQESTWLQAMVQAFPDVQNGDRLTGLHTPGAGARFWFNARPRAAVRDTDFSRVFFGIWLSEASSEPQLRASLLGNKPA